MMHDLNANNSEGAGIIMFNSEGNILLVKGVYNGKWSFPKGQTESCDSDYMSTAVREVYEEIGLRHKTDYYLLDNEPFKCFDRLYFFARIYSEAEKNIKLAQREISDYRWLNIQKSCHFWADLNCGVRNYIKKEQQWM
jgi:8-oxo-dGTP pyrophosphatase MutT (NUDIX family)